MKVSPGEEGGYFLQEELVIPAGRTCEKVLFELGEKEKRNYNNKTINRFV